MGKTRRELIDAVLDNLGILVPAQAPSDEEVSRVDGHVDTVLAELAALDIVHIPDIGTASPPTGGEIDDVYFNGLADCLAWAVAPAFNLAGDASLKVIADEAERRLRRISRPARGRKFLKTDTQLRAGSRRFAVFNWVMGR